MARYLALILIAVWVVPAGAVPMLSSYEARLEMENVAATGGMLIHLLSGGPFGTGGVAHGLVDLDNGTTPPVNSFWLAQDATTGAAPADNERVITFSFDNTGDFMGIQPTPFKVFLNEYPPDPVKPALGELDFSGVSDAALGSLDNISGLELITSTGTIEFAPFSIRNVPEPSVLALLGIGLAGIGFARKRMAA